MAVTITPLLPAQLDFSNDTPVSQTYDDVYFSKAGGVEESDYVYLQGNDLARRFTNARRFVIAETGFGSGLNFLLAAQLWQRSAPKDAQLHYISIEKHPMRLDDLKQAHLSLEIDEAIRLHACYPLLVQGAHERQFTSNIRLTLLFDDIVEALKAMSPDSVDAWFLDGFAPAKNPDMWHLSHLQQIGAATKAGGTFATFTAVGEVKRGLQSSGFEVAKRKGFGFKRDMLVGIKPHAKLAKTAPKMDVIVIGGGLAGASAADACAKHDCRVHLIERHAEMAMEASGNPAGVLYPYMANGWDAATAFYLQGFSYTLGVLDRVDSNMYDLCGMLHYVKPSDDQARFQAIAETLSLDAHIAYWDGTMDALSMPRSGWINVPVLTRALASHASITLHQHHEALNITYEQGRWIVRGADNIISEAEYLVVANAQDASALLDEYLPMNVIRGQITYLPERYVRNTQDQVLCYGGYITPAIDGMHYVGATFDKGVTHLDVLREGHEANIALLREHCPDILEENIDYDALEGRAAYRTVSHDRMPIVGRLHDGKALHDIVHQKPYRKNPPPNIPRKDKAYISVAHGARGTVSAPLAGAMIAADICNGVKPVNQTITELLDPARFTLRAWRKNKLGDISP